MKSPYSNSVNCAACHVELLMPPLGKSAGLCAGLACIQPGTLTAQRLRDFNLVAQMILSGRMKAELEEDTGISWLEQVPPQAPKPQPVSYDDDGTPRFLSTSSPHGQTVLVDRDRIFGGSDPRLEQYRDEQEAADDGTPTE